MFPKKQLISTNLLRLCLLSSLLAVFSSFNLPGVSQPRQKKPTSALKLIENPVLISQSKNRSLSNFDNQDHEYWQDLCNILNRAGRIEEAEAACQRVIELTPHKADAWLIRGNVLFKSGRYAEAIASYDKALKHSSHYSLALTYRCASYSQLGLYQEAIADCDRALEIDKKWQNGSPTLAWYFKGLSFSRIEQWDAALENYEKARSLSFDDDLVNAERCRVLQAMSKQKTGLSLCAEDRVIVRYERALAKQPNEPIIWTNKGLYLESLGFGEKADSAYAQALEILPQSSLILAHHCQLLNDLENYAQAFAACDRALKGDRVFGSLELANVWSQRSRALVGQEKYQEALDSADRAIALDPNIPEAWNNKGVSLWNLKQTGKALTSIDRAININPNYTRGWFNHGRILSSLGRNEEALEIYDRALQTKLEPMNRLMVVDIWVNKSAVLWKLKRCQEAFDSTNKAIALNSDSFAAWYNQGLSLNCLGKYEQALTAYDRAEKIAPADVEVYTAKAVILEKMERYEEALALVEQALSISPDYTPAQNSYTRLINAINTSHSY